MVRYPMKSWRHGWATKVQILDVMEAIDVADFDDIMSEFEFVGDSPRAIAEIVRAYNYPILAHAIS